MTEDELRASGRAITPEEVLALRTVTRGKHLNTISFLYASSSLFLSFFFKDRFQQVDELNNITLLKNIPILGNSPGTLILLFFNVLLLMIKLKPGLKYNYYIVLNL